MDEKIKVTDKRMFTSEGELREGHRDGATSAESADIRSESGHAVDTPETEPEATEPVAREAEATRPPSEPAGREQSATGRELPVPTFMDLVGLLAQPIAMFLGDATLPGGESEENLPLARFHIDLLELVQEKTEGNTTPEEARLLQDLLYQLRIRYVEKAG